MAVVGKPEHNGQNISNSRNGGDGECATKIPGSDWKRHIIWRHLDPRYRLSVPIKKSHSAPPRRWGSDDRAHDTHPSRRALVRMRRQTLIQSSAAVFASTKSANFGWAR